MTIIMHSHRLRVHVRKQKEGEAVGQCYGCHEVGVLVLAYARTYFSHSATFISCTALEAFIPVQ